MSRRILPIGIQTFRKIREGDHYYVDKTDFALRLIEEGTHYFLSRPRRVNIRSAHLRGKKVRDTGGKIGYKVRHGRHPSSQRYRWAAATADMPR